MNMMRCPTCLTVLLDPDPMRCPGCNKRLQRRRRHRRSAIVLEGYRIADLPPLPIDLVLYERMEAEASAPAATESVFAASAPPAPAIAEPVAATPPSVGAEPDEHTAMFQPSQLDPEMRGLLDDLYRKARAELEEEERGERQEA